MADVRCPNCGKENPDFLSFCQFCQTPLVPANTMHTGDKPTKKTTGELEPVLPDWLRDVRQQARDSAEEEAAGAASMPKVQKEEPPDLLAGLASQSAGADDEEIPDWLAGLTSKGDEKHSTSSASAARQGSDFFAQFEKPVSGPQSEPEPPAAPAATTGPVEGVSPASSERDELYKRNSSASEEPVEPFVLQDDSSPIDQGWNKKEEPAAPAQEEDLSWLRNLEAEAKKTGDLSTPKQEDDWTSVFGAPSQAGSADQEDLSWLDRLGALPASEGPRQDSAEPSEDAGWLHALSEPQGPPAATPSAPEEDLSWLAAFAESAPPAQNEQQPPASQDDLSWLDELGGINPQSTDQKTDQPSASGEGPSWLQNLQGAAGPLAAAALGAAAHDQPEETPSGLPHVSPFVPRRTQPLEGESDQSIPDWLKSATEEPFIPLGSQSLDQFREDYNIPSGPEEPFSWKNFGASIPGEEEEPVPSQPETPAVDPAIPAALFSQDVDSIFSSEMPDWLAHPEPGQPAEEIGIHAEGGETLSPADLPAWVQAMRPVEAFLATSVAGQVMDDQPVEREGPLAGFKGVIPLAAIGSLRKPQPIPLKLQATEEQQASAVLMEQILLAETTPRPLVSAPMTISQRNLRWVIAGLLLMILGAVFFSGTQIVPVSTSLPLEASGVQNVVMNIPANAPVLVILDYEPALAGEMEAVSGPVLNQMVLLSHPQLSFIATSPSGNALVERLLANTDISQPNGQGYIAGQDYTNLGYLPGGESGVITFIQSPQAAIPASPVSEFSQYAAILLLTDHGDSARKWVEQLHTMEQTIPAIASQPLLAVSSAQAGPMVQPYVSAGQVDGLISGLAIGARYEALNNYRPGLARSYWDAFSAGLMIAVAAIVIGSLWSFFAGRRARRAEAAEG